MDGGTDGGLTAWMIDAAAALALAAAAGVCGTWLAGAEIGMLCAALALGAGLWSLRQVSPEPLRFAMPLRSARAWEQAFTSDGESDCLELTDRVEDRPPRQLDGAIVVRLSSALPTPGELQRRIEQHLRQTSQSDVLNLTSAERVVPLAADASAALRSALGELRRATQ